VIRLGVLALAWAAGAGVAAGTADAAPFSHKIHLGLQLECTYCHAAAPASTNASDNLLPATKVCLNCHEDGQTTPINQPPPISRVAHFSHAQHLKMGNLAPAIASAIDKKTYLQPPGDIRRHLDSTNACKACHRGLEESDRVTRALLPQMADCIVCHSEIDNPFSCEKCHAKGEDLKPASHVAGFMSAHNSGKMQLDKPSCVICHGATFRCLGCH
jgi:predicted CXXCH cytochrome family protein